MVAAALGAAAAEDRGHAMDLTPTVRYQLDEGAYPPERAHATDAGSDLRTPVMLRVPPHGFGVVDTGVHVELPPHTAGLLVSKSGLYITYAVTTTGLVDQGYTGSVRVGIVNNGNEWLLFRPGDKITQLVVMPVLYPTWELATTITGGPRGSAGFGSTGR